MNTENNKNHIPFSSLVPFLLITFGIGWGIIALYILLPDQMNGIFGQITGDHPLFFLAVYAPAIAAFILVIKKAGFDGFIGFIKRVKLWRVSPLWYAFLFIGLPLVFYGGCLWKGNLFTEPFPFPTFNAFVIAFLLSVIKGPMEEFGWRGFALPLFQRKFAPIWASVIIGLIWGFWHLPAFLLSGTQQSAWSFTPFLLGTVAISLIMTSLYNASRGSIFLAALMHFQLMNPIWPDAQPYDTYILLGVAALIIWFDRKTMFSRDTSNTKVFPEEMLQPNPL